MKKKYYSFTILLALFYLFTIFLPAHAEKKKDFSEQPAIVVSEKKFQPKKAFSTDPKKVQAAELPKLGEAELNSVVKTLNASGSQRYHYLVLNSVFEKGKVVKIRINSTENIKGLFLNRDHASMKSLGNGFYDDYLGNLVFKGNLKDRSGKRFSYSITFTQWGDNIFGADRDNDGIIEVVLGSSKDGRLWMIGQENLERLLTCMEEAGLPSGSGSDMIEAVRICLPCLDPMVKPGSALTSEEMGCVNRQRDGGATVGGLGGSLRDNGTDLFGEPDCKPEEPGQGATVDAPSVAAHRGAVAEHKEQAKWWRELAESLREAGDEDGARNAENVADAHWEAATRHHRAATRFEEAISDYNDPKVSYDESVESATDAIMARADANEAAADALERAEDFDREYEKRGGGVIRQPGIGPDGMPRPGFEDPRCAGNKTSLSQGTIWGDFCRNKDGSHIGLMECISKMVDSTYAITGGRCWEVIGPDDSIQVVCKKENRRKVDEPGGDPGVGPSPGKEIPGLTGELGRRGRVTGRYIDATPMGGIISARCAKVGCPGDGLVGRRESSETR